MKRILFIMRKEISQLRRDRKMLPIVFIAPVMQLFILGYAANLDVNNIRTAFCDLDHTVQSRELADKFISSGYFLRTATVERYGNIDRLLDMGTVQIALVIPRGFGSDISAGKTASVQVIADGSDSNSSSIGMNYARMIVSAYSGKIAAGRIARTEIAADASRAKNAARDSHIELVPRVWFNPTLSSRHFLVPGILALLLMVMTMLLTSLAIVKEKEQGTMEQLIVTPITSRELILGKLAPFIVIGFIDVFLVLAATHILFGIDVTGSLGLLLLFTAVFLLSTLGLGLFVSTVSRTQQQAMMTAVFFVLLPMVFLSGFVFPIENMPRIIQLISYLLPLRYYFVIIRGLFLRGAGFALLWDEGLALLIFGVVILLAASLRFRKRLD